MKSVDMATRASNRVNRGVGPVRLIDELAATPARHHAPDRPPGSATPPLRPAGPALSPQPPVQLFHQSPPPLPQVGAGPRLVAPVLQDILQHGGRHAAQLAGGRHAAQLAGREAAWELQQNAAVQRDQAEDEHEQEGNGQDVFDLRRRTRPQVPQAAVEGADVIGWKAIDRLCGWDSFLVECRTLQEVPEQNTYILLEQSMASRKQYTGMV